MIEVITTVADVLAALAWMVVSIAVAYAALVIVWGYHKGDITIQYIEDETKENKDD